MYTGRDRRKDEEENGVLSGECVEQNIVEITVETETDTKNRTKGARKLEIYIYRIRARTHVQVGIFITCPPRGHEPTATERK